MAAKNRKTNITGLVIDLPSRVICQNVCFYIGIQLSTIHDFNHFHMAAKIQNGSQNCATNISGFIIDLQSRVICQNVCFINMGIKLDYYLQFQ